MTIIFSDGFESEDFSNWDGSFFQGGLDSATVVDSPVHSGDDAAEYVWDQPGGGGQSFYLKNLASGYTTLFYRTYFYFATLPTTSPHSVNMLRYYSAGGGALLGQVNFAYDGTGYYFDLFTAGSAYQTINTGQWYLLEYELVISDTIGSEDVWLDQTNIASSSNQNTGLTPIQRIVLGGQSSYTEVVTVDFDDVAVGDAYIGPTVEAPALGTFLTCLGK